MKKPGHKERLVVREEAHSLVQKLTQRGCQDIRQRRSRKGRTVVMWTETAESLRQEDIWTK